MNSPVLHRVCALALLLLLVSTASANDKKDSDKVSITRAEAEAFAKAGKHMKCGKAYQQLYNESPTEGGDELLYNAGVCFEKARSVGTALRMYHILERQFPKSRLVQPALLRSAEKLEAIAELHMAAKTYERFARMFPRSKDAIFAEQKNITLRRALGEDREALRAIEGYVRAHARKHPEEATRALLTAAEIYRSQGNSEQELRTYERVLAASPRLPGAGVLADSRSGEILWSQSCKGAQEQGTCASAVPWPKGKHPVCSSSPAYFLKVQNRDRKMAAKAQEHFRSAIARDQSLRRAGPSASSRLLLDPSLASARFHILEPQFEEFLSQQRFDPKVVKQAQRVASEYMGITGETKAPETLLAALFRHAQVLEHSANLAASRPLPASLRRASKEKQRQKRCQAQSEEDNQLRSAAIEAYRLCAHNARQINFVNHWSRSCEAALQRLDPKSFPESREIMPTISP